MKFTNYKNKMERPYSIYADCESTLEQIDIKQGDDSSLINKHKVNTCCYYFVCNFDDSKNKLKTFEGDNCIEDMIVELHELSNTCIEEMRNNQELIMTKGNKKNFFNATKCSICNGEFRDDEKNVEIMIIGPVNLEVLHIKNLILIILIIVLFL